MINVSPSLVLSTYLWSMLLQNNMINVN